MAVIAEVMGLSLPYSSSNPAASKAKMDEIKSIGKDFFNLDKNILPKTLLLKTHF